MSKIAGALLAAAGVAAGATGDDCRKHAVDFIILDGDATVAAIEDDIRAELAKVGITVTARKLKKDELNGNMTAGQYNMVLSETWGPPYDPHSFAAAWLQPDEAHFAAFKGLAAPKDRAWVQGKVNAVLGIEDAAEREAAWKEILTATHEQAIDLPLYGKRIPAVLSNRLSSYRAGLQQFDYPLHTLRVETGSRTITVAPGSQTGLFHGVGRLDAHSYRPNEFWANNMVYEGLLEYGPGGEILPSLAKSWKVEETGAGGERYTFTLREGVTFHDGSDWNCAVAKMNFDNVMAAPLTTGDWHGWYQLPAAMASWRCVGDFEFVVELNKKYYPFLQELTYIRPLRMQSMNTFVGGAANNALNQNSCPSGWGEVKNDGVTVTCVGVTGIAGTGRWRYVSTTTTDGTEVVQDGTNAPDAQKVVMERFSGHWAGAAAASEVLRVEFVKYGSHAEVKAALEDGSLDAAIGDGVLDPEDVAHFRTAKRISHHVSLTEVLQNRLVILNAARAPTDDLEVRKTIMHAVDKGTIIDRELAGLAEPVDAAFPRSAPYCDVDLSPRWAYDAEKAHLLCRPGVGGAVPSVNQTGAPAAASDDGLAAGYIVLIVMACVAAVAALVFAVFLVSREKQGRPVYMPAPSTAGMAFSEAGKPAPSEPVEA